MPVHRARTDAELGRDLLRVEPERLELQYLDLALGKR